MSLRRLEIDCSTGLSSESLLVDEELAEYSARAAEWINQQVVADLKSRERLQTIRGRANEDPAFKALAEHLGISLEEI